VPWRFEMKKILIIDDEIAKTDESKGFERKYGCPEYEFIFEKDKQNAIKTLEAGHEICLILLDIVFDNMNEPEGFEAIKRISKEIWPGGKAMLSGNEYGLPMLNDLKKGYPDIPVVMLSSKRVPDILLWCWQHGACYYIMKPPENRDILKKQLDTFSIYSPPSLLIGNSEVMAKVRKQIALVAENESSISVLILGESGTGKELIARSIHEAGCRKGKPFVVVNCAAIPGSLMESELFGHKKGSFTGAISNKNGKFQEAAGGIIFLDEIGELSLELQAKMLRVMARGMRFSPIGSVEEIECDVQIIAATNKNLEQEVIKGSFREDLFYRLNVFPIEAPPLRMHPEDIPILIEHFLNVFKSKQYRSKVHLSGFSEEAMRCLTEYQWPGNIRELENAVEYALVRTSGSIIELSALPDKISKSYRLPSEFTLDLEYGFNIKAYIDNLRWKIIKKAYEKEIVNGKKGLLERVALLLGLPNPSDIQRTILPQIKESCPELIEEIEILLPSRKRK
jgi:DNA-binding NtrC family response regulator